jgi:hypothetical protein
MELRALLCRRRRRSSRPRPHWQHAGSTISYYRPLLARNARTRALPQLVSSCVRVDLERPRARVRMHINFYTTVYYILVSWLILLYKIWNLYGAPERTVRLRIFHPNPPELKNASMLFIITILTLFEPSLARR